MSAVQSITQRWQVRPVDPVTSHLTRVALTAPDTLSTFLQLRADLLRREPHMSSATMPRRVEDDLATTLDNLRLSTDENRMLKTQISELTKELSKRIRDQEELRGTNAKLVEDVAQLQRERDELQAPPLGTAALGRKEVFSTKAVQRATSPAKRPSTPKK